MTDASRTRYVVDFSPASIRAHFQGTDQEDYVNRLTDDQLELVGVNASENIDLNDAYNEQLHVSLSAVGQLEPRCQVCGTEIREKDTDMLCEDCFELQVPALIGIRNIQQLLRDGWSDGFDDYTWQVLIDHLSDAGFNPNPLGLRRTPAERMDAALRHAQKAPS